MTKEEFKYQVSQIVEILKRAEDDAHTRLTDGFAIHDPQLASLTAQLFAAQKRILEHIKNRTETR